MWNAGLAEKQAGIKTAGRNINKLRYADDTTLMAESEEELKSLLMKVKETEVHDIVQEMDQDHPQEKEMQKRKNGCLRSPYK